MCPWLPITVLGAASPASAGFLGWQIADVPMLLMLPVLLVLSGFFSGSETALFSLTEAERVSFRDRHAIAYRALDALLADQRMLLITILLGNMTVNVLYFVVTSVLMMHATGGAVTKAIAGIVFLFVIIAVGEVGPKMIASIAHDRFAAVAAPLLYIFHRAIGPIRLILSHLVIGPLSRLTAPASAPPGLHDSELRALLDVSERSGVIDGEEQRLLREVLGLRRMKVRDVMTPRVNMIALPVPATREQVAEVTRTHRLGRIPIYGDSLDDIVGILDVKKFLLDPGIDAITDPRVLRTPEYVPDLVTLDRLLERFRSRDSPVAIVVNEYGGTEGVVAAEDVVEEVVGDIVGPDETPAVPPRLIGLGAWTVSGALGLPAFADAFSLKLPDAGAASIGVLVAQMLGRAPEVGDCVVLEGLELEVAAVDRRRVSTLVVRLREGGDDGGQEATP